MSAFSKYSYITWKCTGVACHKQIFKGTFSTYVLNTVQTCVQQVQQNKKLHFGNPEIHFAWLYSRNQVFCKWLIEHSILPFQKDNFILHSPSNPYWFKVHDWVMERVHVKLDINVNFFSFWFHVPILLKKISSDPHFICCPFSKLLRWKRILEALLHPIMSSFRLFFQIWLHYGFFGWSDKNIYAGGQF